MFDIAGIGICCVDYISLLESYPEPDRKIEAISTSMQGGGPVPTAVCTASRLGVKAAFIGLIGDDSDGCFIKEELESFRVDTSHLVIRQGCSTSRAFIWADMTNGTRNVVLDRKRTGSLSEGDIPTHLLEEARIVHLDGRDTEASLSAARTVRESGGQVSLDVGSLREGIELILPLVDHLVVSSEFAFGYCGSSDPSRCIEILRGGGHNSCVVTCGQDGAHGWERDQSEVHQPAHRFGAVMDTTGAGDVYHGAYLFGLIEGWGLRERMQFASVAAALKCREIGGRSGIPTYDDVERVIGSKGH